MSVLSPWAAELLKASPVSSLLPAPGSVAPSPTVGSGPIGPDADLASMVAAARKQQEPDPNNSRLVSILQAISQGLAARRGGGPGTSEPGAVMPMGASLGALAGTPSPDGGDTDPPPALRATSPGTAVSAPDLPQDFNYDDYVKFVSGLESGGSYTVPNQAGSGAYGRFQFMPSTLDGMNIDKEEFKKSPALQDAAMKAFTQQNYQALQLATGLDKPDAPSMYLAHWFGPQGAAQVLFASPMTKVEKIFPKSWITQNNLTGKTTGDIVNMVYRKYDLYKKNVGGGPNG